MEYCDEEWLLLSGIQHFSFCRRQWALIHIEQLWEENLRTVEGEILHSKAHDSQSSESRRGVLIMRGISVQSARLGISGQCDVLEFHSFTEGITLDGREGRWKPYPVEYKRGVPKENDADLLQLCAQAMCLEEMLACRIEEGALYYGETRHRERVVFTDELRAKVIDLFTEMHELFKRGYTPKVKPHKGCNACSMRELCLPKMLRGRNVGDYLHDALNEDADSFIVFSEEVGK